ncbi:N-acetyl-gamma-glutamyl-phosphate reductase [Robertkochia aurantiaca]|uniref:N-acetyl-gamma-glutamyl-phosphate reductase n=1 Tax=Robertkochia aurantiaca TaxID=2873700 RepID=UPI001CCECEA9|nr:N-acetyl-gamma-glutamyl-phosphate reductase [Robertkochia sp. 3YJGBD-33]
MIKVGIIGGSGYTAGELLRLLSLHPEAAIDFVYSTTRPDTPVSSVHQDLKASLDLNYSADINAEVDVVFLCLGHGRSKAFLEQHEFSEHTKIIDLSNDFRLKDDSKHQGKEYVYGLPELNKQEIITSSAVANPGCFATAIQLALLPLAADGSIADTVHTHAITGSTGAGASPSDTTHFSWRDNNISWYKPFTHQHLGEINQSLSDKSGKDSQIMFLPFRGNFSRGIMASSYLQYEGSLDQAGAIFREYYESAPFVHVSDEPLHLKQVVNTNHCFIHLHKHEDQLLVTSVIDNLVKGASGQAIQNMNLMFGLAEQTGLKLKASYF